MRGGLTPQDSFDVCAGALAREVSQWFPESQPSNFYSIRFFVAPASRLPRPSFRLFKIKKTAASRPLSICHPERSIIFACEDHASSKDPYPYRHSQRRPGLLTPSTPSVFPRQPASSLPASPLALLFPASWPTQTQLQDVPSPVHPPQPQSTWPLPASFFLSHR